MGDQNAVASIVVSGKEEQKKKAGAEAEPDGKGYYGVCILGGMVSAGTTHLAITPLDVVKVNMQLSPIKYPSIYTCFSSLLREQGPCTFWRGWGSKLFGYGLQGGCRFGLYEYFKTLYSNLIPADYQRNRSVVFFTSSATAELFANLCLCPFEAIKVQVQAQPGFARGLIDGFPRIYASEGLFGFYRGLGPLMARNIPFSMVMFSTFEHSVDILYRKVMKARKEDCSKGWQLGITCMAGYAAGSVGSLVSNPADNLVTHLYNNNNNNNNRGDGVIMAVKKIGCLNLFTRSLPIRVLLVGPVVTLQWLLFDTIKIMSGLPTSGEVKTDTSLHHNICTTFSAPRN